MQWSHWWCEKEGLSGPKAKLLIPHLGLIQTLRPLRPICSHHALVSLIPNLSDSLVVICMGQGGKPRARRANDILQGLRTRC